MRRTVHILRLGMRDDTIHQVLVTGATGFIGRALRPALLARGLGVRATTRHLGRAPRQGGEDWVARLGPHLQGK